VDGTGISAGSSRRSSGVGLGVELLAGSLSFLIEGG